jgi:putative tricarboxylic transport membrane protein
VHNVLTQKRDYYAGGLMVLIGAGTVLEASHYQVGTLFHMGPGFFPIILGVVLMFVGILIAGAAASSSSMSEEDHVHLPEPQWRGWGCIIAGPLLFIFLGKYFGLIPAAFSCVFVSALGDRESTLKSALVLAAGVTVFGVFLFSYVLQVSLPLWKLGTP